MKRATPSRTRPGQANAERKRAEEELRKASWYARSLLEASLDPLVTISREGKITDVNQATEKVTGISREKLIGSDFSNYFTDPEGARRGYEQVFAQGAVQDYPLAIRSAAGRVTDVLYNATVFKNELGEVEGVFAAARDMTERKRAERALRALSDCNESLMRATDEPSLLKRICDLVVNVGGYRMAWVGYAEHDEKKTVRVVAESGFEAGYLDAVDITWADVERGRGPTGTAIRTGKAAACHDVTSDPRFAPWREHALRRGYRSTLALPLKNGEQVLGALSIYATEAGALDSAEQQLLAELANNLSYGIVALRAKDESKRAEEALQQSEQRYRLVFSEMLVGFALLEVVYDENGNPCDQRYLEVNPAFETHTGLPRDRVLGKTIRQVLPGIEPFWIETYGKVATTGESIHFENYAQPLQRWFEVTAFRTHAGYLAVTFADITERKRAEEVRERLAAVVDSSDDAIISKTLEGTVTAWNHGAEKVFGYSASEAVGKSMLILVPPDRINEEYSILARVGRGESVEHFETVRIRKDGRRIDVSVTISPIRDSSGAIVGASKVARDITDRKRVEQGIRSLNQQLEERVQQRTAQLHESEQRVRRKLDSILSPQGDLGNLDLSDILDIAAVQSLADDFYRLAQIPMFIVDLKGNPVVAAGWQEICTKFHRAHPEACRNCQESDLELSTGVVPGEFKLYKCKNNLWDVVTPIMVGSQHMGNLFSGQFFFADEPVDREMFRAQAAKYGFDEKEYLAALDRVPHLKREAVDTGMAFYVKLAQLLSQLSYSAIKLARSMTETGRVNGELAASVKELEAFTYSVSHDLRAPLRHISGFSKILSEEFGPSLPTDAQHHLQRIQEGTRRMGLLVDDLLNLARIGRRELSLQICGLKSVVEEVIAELLPECEGRNIEWNFGNLPFVECDPGLIKQVFQNLISNALKFTRPRSPAVIEIGQSDQEGTPAVFVRDNGVGFNMKYADKLFGVFQRLHRPEDFEGTGVGLATVQRIIHKHGGRIWTEAQLDKGATFYFTLGAAEKTGFKPKAAAAGDQV